jgi:uncharacterized protein (TIGR03085 family)
VTTYAARERAELADLFDRLSPDAPTLCEGWSVRDLAAHLVMRERRPDAAIGILVKPFARLTDKARRDLAARPWPELVAMFRAGPPRWSPLNLAPDDAVNLVEFFVHSEDVRRAQTGWTPRRLDPALEDQLWRRLRTTARLLYRKARIGVILRRAGTSEQVRGKDGTPAVTVTGPASELLLHSLGRTAHARVEITGDPEAVRIFAATPLRS